MHITDQLQIFNVRVGKGAAILPRNVVRIEWAFPNTDAMENSGQRQFYNEYMPRLKYHNPAVGMIVNTTLKKDSTARMTVYLSTVGTQGAAKPSEIGKAGDAGGPTSEVAVSDKEALRAVQVPTDIMDADNIFQNILTATGGKAVEPTPEDVDQLNEYKRINEEKAIDAVQKRIVAKKLGAEKRAEEMARAAAAAAV